MKSRLSVFGMAGLVWFAFITLAGVTVFAQEGELQVVDEVVAQVNDDVITLSMLKRETKERIDALKERGVAEKTAVEQVTSRQAELIATLIKEQLLLQRGKELDFAKEVEDEVNRRMFDVARGQGINSIEKLDEALRQSGEDPAAIRQTMRTEIMKQMVIQQEVDRPIYLGSTMEELKKYFEANKDKFLKPESITISEIFLSLAGKNEADVKARAQELIAQLRAGADFVSVAAANSEREENGRRTAPDDKGKVGTFEMPSLREDVAVLIKDLKVGGITEPLAAVDGYHIFRLDERTAASDTAVFNENKVREAITIERSPEEREAYLQKLLSEAFVKISDNYVAAVEPLLTVKRPAAAKTDEATRKKGEKGRKP